MKKNRTDREKVLRRVLIAPGTFLAQGFVYPFVGWLSSKTGYESPQHCEAVIPLDFSMGIYTVLLVVLVTLMIPILSSRTKSAIYFMLYGVVALLLIGGWFVAMGLLTMLCEPLHYGIEMAIPLLISFVIASMVIFVVNKRRMQQILVINEHVYDFKSMQYRQLAIHNRLDGRSSASITFWVYLGAFVGVFLANIPFGDMLNLADLSKDWLLVLVCLFVGFAFSGYLAMNQLYLIWLIYHKSKEMGGKMMVRELVKKGT